MRLPWPVRRPKKPLPLPNLSFDERHVQVRKCPDCGGDYVFVTAFLLRAGSAYAVYYASCSGHAEAPRVSIDVVFGSWGDDSTTDHVTFSCLLRPDGAMAVDAPATVGEAAEIMGAQLTRGKALHHLLIHEFWDVVDFISLHDPAVVDELAGRALAASRSD